MKIEIAMMAADHQVTSTWALRDEAAYCFPDDPEGGDKKEPGLDKGRDTFGLGVAIVMLLVGGLVAPADGEEGDDRCAKIDDGMNGLGENAERAGEKARNQLRQRKSKARQHREEGDLVFFGAVR